MASVHPNYNLLGFSAALAPKFHPAWLVLNSGNTALADVGSLATTRVPELCLGDTFKCT